MVLMDRVIFSLSNVYVLLTLLLSVVTRLPVNYKSQLSSGVFCFYATTSTTIAKKKEISI